MKENVPRDYFCFRCVTFHFFDGDIFWGKS